MVTPSHPRLLNPSVTWPVILDSSLINLHTCFYLLLVLLITPTQSGGGDKEDDGDGESKGDSESKAEATKPAASGAIKSDSSKASGSLKLCGLHPLTALFLAKLGGC